MRSCVLALLADRKHRVLRRKVFDGPVGFFVGVSVHTPRSVGAYGSLHVLLAPLHVTMPPRPFTQSSRVQHFFPIEHRGHRGPPHPISVSPPESVLSKHVLFVGDFVG